MYKNNIFPCTIPVKAFNINYYIGETTFKKTYVPLITIGLKVYRPGFFQCFSGPHIVNRHLVHFSTSCLRRGSSSVPLLPNYLDCLPYFTLTFLIPPFSTRFSSFIAFPSRSVLSFYGVSLVLSLAPAETTFPVATSAGLRATVWLTTRLPSSYTLCISTVFARTSGLHVLSFLPV